MTVRLLTGDCREVLKTLPDESVHCVVTSPPYWGLRDYGVDGQLGLEPTLGEHIEIIVDVFREIRRVLRKDGTVWLNYGDCYATSPNGRSAADTKAAGNDDRSFRDKPFSTVGPIYDPCGGAKGGGGRGDNKGNNAAVPQGRIVAGGHLKAKDLCMMPARVAIALQEDGWWIRSEIVWAKPNPMPESITDRPATAHDKVFLITKSPRYYFDANAVKEAVTGNAHARKSYKTPDGWDTSVGDGGHGSFHKSGREKGRRPAGVNPKAADKLPGETKQNASFAEACSDLVETRNIRNVWLIPSHPFKDAHFATFPPALVEPCIKAGCPEGGIVLDPFGGAGTVGMVADRLGRNAVLIELNPEYCDIARQRIEADGGMFVEVEVVHG